MIRKRINYNEILKKVDKLFNDRQKNRLLIISSDRREEDGFYHLTLSNGKGSKMMTFENMEEVEKFITSKTEKYKCHIIRVGVLED